MFGALQHLAFAQPQSRSYGDAKIAWDPATMVLVQPDGGYGRMVRMPNRRILCSFEWHGAIYVRSSSDEGRTWANPVTAASYEFGTASNPELLVLQNGSILLSYNERPTDGIHPFTIKISFSQDNGKTWSTGRLIYGAGATSGTGCWEPAQVQLASGEIDLFFSNENLYPSTNEQQITLVRSFDNGVTWSPPEVASFRPGHRDGMAVPLRLNDGSGVVLAIEDNGMAGAFKPAVVSPAGSQRWAALETELPPAVYAGAPYLGQFPTGETVLSVQSADDRNSPGTLDSSRMVVYVGDSRAHGFTNASEPFTVPAGSNGLWNSLFIKNPVTVTAISGTTVGGVAGLWAIDGHLEYQGELPGPAIETVTNAAGGSAGPVAPGELVSIFGFGLDRAKSQSGSGTTVYFNGLASPNASVSDTQITALVPDGVSEIADTVVDCGGAKTYPYALGVTPAAPEVFTQTDGTSQAVATNADSSFNSPAKPAAKGSYLSFWGTGQGHVVSAGGYLKPVLPVRATLGGVDAEVSFAGLIYPGVLQVNIKVPVDAPSSDAVQLILTIGSGASRKTATIAVQ